MDTIGERTNASGDTVETYFCRLVTANNVLEDLVVPYYYDMVYPCEEEPSEGQGFVAASLLSRSRDAFLPDGDSCVRPQPLWFGAVSSLPADVVSADIECQELLGACCVVVEGSMTFTQLSTADGNSMKRWMAATLNDPTIAPGYTVAYIGSELAPDISNPEPNLTPPPILQDRVPGAQAPEEVPEDEGVSLTGMLFLGGLCVALLLVGALLLRRRQRARKSRDVDAAIQHSETPPHKMGNTGGTWEDCTLEDHLDGEDIEVSVLQQDDPYLKVRSVSTVSYHENGYHADNEVVPYNSGSREATLHPRYRFDLAESQRSDIMGTYGRHGGGELCCGPTEITVVPPYPVDEISESEADSWAQTDGTVGSLDDDQCLVDDTEVGEI
jgi:hypothetical protein